MKKPTVFFPKSLKGRMIAGIMLVHAVLMGLIVADMMLRQQRFMEAHISDEGRTFANSLAINAPPWLLSNDTNGLQELFNSLKTAEHIQLALIMDRDGKVLASTDAKLFNLTLKDPVSRQLLETVSPNANGNQNFAQLAHDGLVDSISVIRAGSRHIGYSRVVLDSKLMQAELNAVIHKGIVYTFIAIIAGGLIAWLLVHTLTRRLSLLSKAAEAIASGKPKSKLPEYSGKDEVSRLIRDFNAMSLALDTDAEIRTKMEAQLFAEKERAQVTLCSIGDAVITTDIDGNIEFMNSVAESLTGWSSAEAQRQPLPEVFKIINEHNRRPMENPVDKALRLNRAVDLSNHTILVRRDGVEMSIEDNASPIRDRHGNTIGVVLVFHDITEKQRLTRQLSYQATHDTLTGLYNRQEFERRLAIIIDSASTLDHEHALLYLDLDQFKVINDTCGHAAGDELLRQLTALLQKQVRESDTLARLGGDEFGLLLDNCHQEKAKEIANELLAAIQAFRFIWEDKTYSIAASIGLVMVNKGSGSAATLLSAADTACFAAKDKGRNRIQIFSAEDSELTRRHGEMHWVAKISKAFEKERFRLYYQPIVPLQKGNEDEQHFEILIRMLDENNQLVPPAAFIPAAERYNLMASVDRWVISHTFNWLVANSHRKTCCAINLSGQSLGDENFLGFVTDQIKGSGVEPKKICFEVTETAAIGNLASAQHFIREIKALGCRFSLDDFGSGMSSYAYLKSLPVDFLKIDGGFVKDMVDDPIDYAMVEAINKIGHVMGIQTIAEFVENQAIMDRLHDLGVNFAQGYGIAKPSPLEEMP
ncbi:MAG: EAL domain-containing protein [Betaproteobacteria bacterium]